MRYLVAPTSMHVWRLEERHALFPRGKAEGANWVESIASDPPDMLIFVLYSSNSRRAASASSIVLNLKSALSRIRRHMPVNS